MNAILTFLEALMKWFLDLFRKAPTPAPVSTPVVPIDVSAKPIKIAVINQCSVLGDADVQPVVQALQTQVSRDFAPIYGIDAQLIFVPKGHAAPSGTWQLVLLDNSDQAGALGYHDLTNEGLPIGKVFAKTDIQYGANWTITTSHELLELLADPWINLTVFDQTSNTAGKLYAYEVCDAPEADQYAYLIGNVHVSDFVYPAWFGVPGSHTKFDHMGKITRPLQLLHGGYIGVFDVTKGGGWTQITAEKVLHAHRNDFKEGSRRERRKRGSQDWKKSER
jgi:hypothetical protein